MHNKLFYLSEELSHKFVANHYRRGMVERGTLSQGDGGKGERSDARTFRASSDGIKSPQLEKSGIYPARFSDSSLFGQENLSSQKNARPFQ